VDLPIPAVQVSPSPARMEPGHCMSKPDMREYERRSSSWARGWCDERSIAGAGQSKPRNSCLRAAKVAAGSADVYPAVRKPQQKAGGRSAGSARGKRWRIHVSSLPRRPGQPIGQWKWVVRSRTRSRLFGRTPADGAVLRGMRPTHAASSRARRRGTERPRGCAMESYGDHVIGRMTAGPGFT